MGNKPSMTGSSAPFREMLQRLDKAAKYQVPVLLEGETGTGKEMAARHVHYNSARKANPFIPVNCGCLPENLVENELFGHEKGAYTDAKNRSMGLIELAVGGTIFLDEIETLSYKAQVVLLRFLDRREYRPLGGKLVQGADVRIVAASNENLRQLVAEKTFRADLFYRLNVIVIEVPPLRERGSDIALLAKRFLDRFREHYGQPTKSLHPDALGWMMQYEWPGNVRELENLLHRQFLFAEGDVILAPTKRDFDYAPTDFKKDLRSGETFSQVKSRVIDEFERHYLQCLMQSAHGNVTHAAKAAGKERRALARLLKKHGIDKCEFYAKQSRART